MTTTRQDRSAESGIVITCDECPHFHAFAWSKADAEGAEIRHERLVHPTVFRARKRASNRESIRRRRARHAEESQFAPATQMSEVDPESHTRGTLRPARANA